MIKTDPSQKPRQSPNPNPNPPKSNKCKKARSKARSPKSKKTQKPFKLCRNMKKVKFQAKSRKETSTFPKNPKPLVKVPPKVQEDPDQSQKRSLTPQKGQGQQVRAKNQRKDLNQKERDWNQRKRYRRNLRLKHQLKMWTETMENHLNHPNHQSHQENLRAKMEKKVRVWAQEKERQKWVWASLRKKRDQRDQSQH